MRVPGRAWPMVGSPVVTGATVASTAASVGPYMLRAATPESATRCHSAGGVASPPRISSDGGCSPVSRPASTSCAAIDGVVSTTSMRSRAYAASSSSASLVSSVS